MRTFIGLSFTWLPNRVRPAQSGACSLVPTDSDVISSYNTCYIAPCHIVYVYGVNATSGPPKFWL